MPLQGAAILHPMTWNPEDSGQSWTSLRRRFGWVPLLLVLVMASALLVVQRRQAGTVTYKVGTVDPRFGMTREAFSDAVAQAAALWNQGLDREVFRETGGGTVEINLVYDNRQEAADRLKEIKLRMDGAQGTYEELKAHFETLKQEADEKRRALAEATAAYNARVSGYNARGEAGRHGPLSGEDQRRMETERRELGEIKLELAQRQDELNERVNTLNGFAGVINGLAANHNRDLADFRQVGDGLGPEFSEGEFVQKDGRRTISIYHFPSRDGLVRVLAHELGHAKGLGHLGNPRAVMHRLMGEDTPALTSDDLAAMREQSR